MKQFGKSALSPSYAREAHFKSSAPVSNHFTFDCFSCGRRISISYQLVIEAAGQWEATIGDELATAAKEFYKIGLVGKSQDGGWPSMLNVSCDGYGARYLIYAGVEEYYNSLYRVTIQGVTELLGVEESK